MTGRIAILSGPPGAGKSTIARALAETAPGARAVHLHTDDFYVYIRKGYVEPWKPEAHPQNVTVANALAAAVAVFAEGEFEVLADGIVGPWLLEPWSALVRKGLDVRYVVLRPDEATTVGRGTARTHPMMTDEKVIRLMWTHFSALGPFESHVLDTTGQSAVETTAILKTRLSRGDFRLR